MKYAIILTIKIKLNIIDQYKDFIEIPSHISLCFFKKKYINNIINEIKLLKKIDINVREIGFDNKFYFKDIEDTIIKNFLKNINKYIYKHKKQIRIPLIQNGGDINLYKKLFKKCKDIISIKSVQILSLKKDKYSIIKEIII